MDNYIFSPDNGVIIPDTSEIKTTVQTEFTDAFSDFGVLSLEDATPQGRLIDLETNARTATITFNANVANVLINITESAGAALDAWGSNFGIYRNNETNSSTPVTVTGVANTIIPQNSEAIDVNGIIWKAENEIIIGSSGSATGVFVCSIPGPVALAAGELNKIVASSTIGVDGWETITNSANATPGADEEGDEPYKLRIIQGVFRGSALFGNYESNVSKVDGVRDIFAYDNPYGTSRLLDNITIPPHSVYVCVDGGNSADVAYSLYEVKSAGAGWVGNTTVSVTDKTFGTTNTVQYETPNSINFVFSTNVTNYSNSNADLESQIQNVISNYLNNAYENLGYKKIGIRPIIEPFTIAALIQSQISGISVNSVQAGLKTVSPRATITINKASVTSGIQWASINAQTFGSEVNTNGRFIITFSGSNWQLNSSNIDLSDYGISVTGTPVANDKLIVIYADGQLSDAPIQLYANEIAAINNSDIMVTINE